MFLYFLVLLVVVVQVNHPLYVPYLGPVYEIECVPPFIFAEHNCTDDRYISVTFPLHFRYNFERVGPVRDINIFRL
jgi:hypothetical protein